MGDAHSHSLLSDSTEKIAPSMKAKNRFVYVLYNWYTNNKHVGNRSTYRADIYKAARIFDRSNNGVWHLVDGVKPFLKLLDQKDQQAWLRILLWIGRSDHMFNLFKEVSPFAGKTITAVRFDAEELSHSIGAINSSPLPEIEKLWPPYKSGDEYKKSHLILIFSEDTSLSVHAVKY
jgi:hypothetical protein